MFFGTVMVAALAATAGFSQALAKLSLDALIQRDVPEQVRTSAFARSETLLQMAWVVGGAIGIALPLNGALGMSRRPPGSSPWAARRSPYGVCCAPPGSGSPPPAACRHGAWRRAR